MIKKSKSCGCSLLSSCRKFRSKWSEKEALLVQVKVFFLMEEAHACLRKEERNEWRKAECVSGRGSPCLWAWKKPRGSVRPAFAAVVVPGLRPEPCPSDSCLVVERYLEEERKKAGFSFSSCCLWNRSHCYLESLECTIKDLKWRV